MKFFVSGSLRRQVREAKAQTQRLIDRQLEVMRIVQLQEKKMAQIKEELLEHQQDSAYLLETITEVLNRTQDAHD